MSNETETTSNSTYHLLYSKGWNEAQTKNYFSQQASSSAFSTALIVALTQYVVTMWVLELWQGKKKTNPDCSTTTTSSRPQPYWVTSTLVFWIVYTLLFNDSLQLFVDGTPIGYKIAMPILVFGGVFLHLFVDWAFTKIINYLSSPANDDHDDNDKIMDIDGIISDDNHTIQVDDNAPLVISQPPQTTTILQPKPKLHYMNNIKIFLTNIVILFHIAICVGEQGEFVGWLPTIASKNPSSDWGLQILNAFMALTVLYFMQLFFFISGFFVPKSFDKKGSFVFLQERIKRLGIPPVVYTFFIGPYVQTGLQYLFFYNGSDNFGSIVPLTAPGVTWFPQQLIVFGIIYTFACKKNWTPKMECPTVFGFFLISLMIGTVTGIINLFFSPWHGFFGVPDFFLALLFLHLVLFWWCDCPKE